ncbi:MAG: hypothetical protein Q7S50_00390 [bacterium]|nr:hypothetical protein [bacterium]
MTGIQAAGLLFFWWISVSSNALSVPILTWPNFDGLLLLIFAVILYFFNSRIIAVLLLIVAAYGLISTWMMKVSYTGNVTPPAMGLILAVVALQIALVVFKTYDWQKNNEKLPRSKWVMWALVAIFILTLAGFLLPPVHFWNHTRNEVTLTEKGTLIEYYEPLDKYTFEFPKDWMYDQPPLQYGNVTLNPRDDSNVTVQIERWQPWSIAPTALFNQDAFLKMASDEAATYGTENNLTVETVEMTGPSSVNEARVVYTELDGPKRYVYYIYDRAWSRQTSDSAYFFWRLTADVPKGSMRYDADVQSILSSFRINQTANRDN